MKKNNIIVKSIIDTGPDKANIFIEFINDKEA